jgi:hypothetical protein
MTSNFVVTQRRDESSSITVLPLREQMHNKGESDWLASNGLGFVSLTARLDILCNENQLDALFIFNWTK